MTAKQAAMIAKQAGAEELILTHYSARYRDIDLFKQEAREVFKTLKLLTILSVSHSGLDNYLVKKLKKSLHFL
ncbi:MAG: hypothetical protein KAR79_05480 [Simkaniaceae bacterium]|nr:hypothetical protein [Simkaniaceae bacterium]